MVNYYLQLFLPHPERLTVGIDKQFEHAVPRAVDLARVRSAGHSGVLYSYLHQTPLKVRASHGASAGPSAAWFPPTARSSRFRTNFEAHAPIATTVKRLLVKEGDHVRKGQLLLQLDDADIRTQAARAQAQVKTAQADQSALTTGGTQEEVLTLNAQLVKARSARDAAQRNLDALRRLAAGRRSVSRRSSPSGRRSAACSSRRHLARAKTERPLFQA